MAFEPLFRSITLRNLLSFGPDTPPLELRNLNVLIVGTTPQQCERFHEI
jgi:hypothetical protein